MRTQRYPARVAAVLFSVLLILGSGINIPPAFAASAPIANIPGWPTSYNNNGVDGEVYIDQTAFSAGQASLKLVNRTPKASNVFLAIRQHVPVKPNTTYQVSLKVKGIEASHSSIALNTGWSLRKALPAGTFDWQSITCNLTTDASATSYPFTVLSEGVTAALWLDDMTMVEAGTDTNLLQNGDFEAVPQAAAVSADPPSGPVESGTAVSLATATVSAAVYYTTDSTDPVLSPTKQWYTGSVAIDHSLILKAYATGLGYTDSPISTFSYSVNGAGAGTVIDEQTFFGSLAEGKAVPVYYADGIVLDGDLSEWNEASFIELPLPGSGQANLANWQGASDLLGRVYFAYDDDSLYLAAKVRDNVQSGVAGASMWSGDSIQFASGTSALYGPEYGFAHVNGEPEVWTWNQGDTPPDKGPIQLRTGRIGSETIYEARIPWNALHAGEPGTSMPFNFVLNDNDGAGRKNWVEWTPGIGKTKDQHSFGNLFFIPQNSQWAAWLDRDYTQPEENRFTAEQNEPLDFQLNLVNSTDQIKQFQARISQLDPAWRDITVPAHSVLQHPITASFAETGQQSLAAEVRETGTGEERTLKWELGILPSGTQIEEDLEQLEEDMGELKALLEQAEAQGIAVDYEKLDITVIDKFIPYGKEDVVQNKLERAQYVRDQLLLLYQQTRDRLEAYLAGTQTSFPVPQYVTGDVYIDQQSFIGNTVNSQTGAEESRPIFFTGYGHFAQVKKDIPVLSQLGSNMIQMETGPNRILQSPNTILGWSTETRGEAKASFSYGTEAVHEGSRALKIVNLTPKAANVYGTVWQKIAVKPNTEYEFSMWVKGSNVNNTWFGTFATRLGIPAGTYNWQKIAKKYRTGSAETSLDFRIVSENVTDSLLIDSIGIVESGTTANLAAYPGFEDGGTVVKEDYLISTAHIRNDIQQALQSAGEHNQAVSLLLSPHYFPDFLLQKYPEIRSNNSGFIKFNFNHPKAREAIEDYLRTLIPMVKDYPALHNIVLSNEPVFASYKDPAQKPAWQAYLKQMYSDIGQLNAVYNTAYESFERVTMPQAEERTALYYDWISFNDQLFAEWHEWMADIIHEMAPDIPVSVKIMGGVLAKSQLAKSPLSWGIDPEQISGLSDLNGLDAWDYLHDEGATIIEKLKYYDLLSSYKTAPVFNSEDHIIPDRDSRYVPEQVPHVRNDIWQGAIHGRSASTIWVWERTNDPASDFEGSVLYRPDVVSAIGKTGMDLNRLAREVTSFQNAPAETAVLYSKASNLYRPAYLEAVDRVYSALSLSGQKVGFVSEKQIREGKLSSVKLLIIPDARNVDAETVEAVKVYMKQGGQAVVLGEESFVRDAHNRAHPEAARSYIMAHAAVIPVSGTATALTSPTLPALQAQLIPLLRQQNLLQVELTDAQTGETVSNVEWRTSVYEGRLLLNVANYSWQAKQINILLDGQATESAQNLIQGKSLGASGLTLDPFSPLLLDLGPAENSSPDTPDGNPNSPDSRPSSPGSGELPDKLLLAAGQAGELRLGDEARLTLPSGFMDTAVSLSIRKLQTVPDSGRAFPGELISSVVEITMEPSRTPAKSAALSIRFNKAQLKAQQKPVMFAFNEQERTWVDIGGTVDRDQLIAGVDLFTKFAVFALSPSPDDPGKEGISTGLALNDIGGHWARDNIVEAVTAGLANGYGDGTFRPDQPVVREEFLTLLVRALQPAESLNGLSFADAQSVSGWARSSTAAAVQAGWIEGNEDGTIRPGTPLSRAELAVLLMRAHSGTELKPAAARIPFKDEAAIPAWAQAAVSGAAEAGLLQGDAVGRFLPTKTATRAEAVVVLLRMMKKESSL
ncbi:S-layer homology domain-containing protein [Paenibacillus sp. P46E]|uniref:S-layer homology domain-containing protein n=1 Tax=Paenibacillus sp. P46E TaxID=1349436 RepID=UPI00093C44F4|nr:S-layer homology domain-containing protein [Paenibacillus sp. P46E]OKP99166.1 hypothetical protein A3849_06935 [Paenibacillus sp. P46E]